MQNTIQEYDMNFLTAMESKHFTWYILKMHTFWFCGINNCSTLFLWKQHIKEYITLFFLQKTRNIVIPIFTLSSFTHQHRVIFQGFREKKNNFVYMYAVKWLGTIEEEIFFVEVTKHSAVLMWEYDSHCLSVLGWTVP